MCPLFSISPAITLFQALPLFFPELWPWLPGPLPATLLAALCSNILFEARVFFENVHHIISLTDLKPSNHLLSPRMACRCLTLVKRPVHPFSLITHRTTLPGVKIISSAIVTFSLTYQAVPAPGPLHCYLYLPCHSPWPSCGCRFL